LLQRSNPVIPVTNTNADVNPMQRAAICQSAPKKRAKYKSGRSAVEAGSIAE
jgi:hypothetical protein